MIERTEDPAGGKPPQAESAPQADTAPQAPPPPDGARAPGREKAEPEKARTEIEAGDVADDLADFA